MGAFDVSFNFQFFGIWKTNDGALPKSFAILPYWITHLGVSRKILELAFSKIFEIVSQMVFIMSVDWVKNCKVTEVSKNVIYRVRSVVSRIEAQYYYSRAF